MSPAGKAAWLSAAQRAFEEIAGTLRAGPCHFGPLAQRAPDDLVGAWVALAGERCSVQVGLVVDGAAGDGLTRIFLGMGEGPKLPFADVADALGELANVLAGGVKRRMAGEDPGMQLGLPLVVQGPVTPVENAEITGLELTLGSVSAGLVVIHP